MDLQRYQMEGLKILRVYGVRGSKCSCPQVACKHPGKHPAPWPKSQNKGVYNARKSSDVSQSELDGYNVGVATGEGLIVVDIDPRNGGHIAWHDISRNQYLPDTWEVSTGSGGTHIYYRLPAGVSVKSQSFRGIDIQSTGKYVVAPPSVHVSGSSYEWSGDSGSSIAEIPPWLLELLQSHETAIQAAMVDDDTGGLAVPASYEWPLIEKILEQLTPRIGYDAWVAVGMGLHSTGAARAFEMWDSWSAKDPTQYDAADCKRKWASFKILPGQRYTYRYLYSLAEMYGIRYGDDDFFRDWKSEPVTLVSPDEMEAHHANVDIASLDHGPILNALFYEALDTARVRINSIALASAIQVLSAGVQGTFKTWTDAPLSLYQWVTAGASAGKNSYVEFANQKILEIHPNILAPHYGSSGGLRVCLQAFNSLVAVRDEWHDDYLGLAGSTNEYAKQILSDYKTLFNAPSQLAPMVIKGSSQPAIKNPIFGLLGFGTISGLAECGKLKDFLTSGAASRFLYWIHPTYEESQVIETADRFEALPMADALMEIRKVFRRGQMVPGEIGDSWAKIQELQAWTPAKGAGKAGKGSKGKADAPGKAAPAASVPEMCPTDYVTATPEAKEKLLGYEANIKAQVAKLDPAVEDDIISLMNRQGLAVVKLACLRALSGIRTVCEAGDVVWAIQVVGLSVEAVKRFFELSGSGSPKYDQEKFATAQRVERFIAKADSPVSKSLIINRLRLMDRLAEETLLHLCAANKVECFDGYGLRVYPSKITGKMRFALKEQA